MGNVLTLREIDLLEFLGFKPEYPDEIDRDYCQYVKKIPQHLIMTGLHIIVSDNFISVWCKEAKGGISGGEF